MKFPMLGIDTTIDEHGLEFSNGEHVDSFFVCWLFNALDIPRRFYSAFEMVSENPYLWIMLANNANSVYEVPSERILVAEYGPDINSPFYRLYCYRHLTNGAAPKEAVTAQVSCKVGVKSIHDLLHKYNDHLHTEKVKKWVENLKVSLSPTTMVAEGRLENTTVEKTIILYRQTAGCVLCGHHATSFVGSTIGIGESILYIANTCTEHQEVAKKHPSILHFVFSLFQIGLDLGEIIKSKSIPESVMDLIKNEVEKELKVSHKKTRSEGGEITLTFFRKSGFRIILRLKELMDYGYMIDKPNGKPYRRIDSAPDHPDIPFFPDHIHLKPKKDNSNVISSFTYGFPLLDLPLIKKLVEEGEREFESK